MPRADDQQPLLGAVDASSDVQPSSRSASGSANGGSAASAGATASTPASIPNWRDVATAHPGLLRSGTFYRCACPDFASEADTATVTGALCIKRRVDLRNPAERPTRGRHPTFRDVDGRPRPCEERLTTPSLRTYYIVLPSGAGDGSHKKHALETITCGGWCQTLYCIWAEICTPRCCRSRKGRERTISQTFDVWEPILAKTRCVTQYHGICNHSQPAVAEVLRTIASTPEDAAILVHCSAGKDRTGVVVAVALAACGVPRDAILTDYALSDNIGEQWVAAGCADPEEPALAAAMAARPMMPMLGAPREDIAEMLDTIEARCGSVRVAAFVASALR